MVAGCVLASVCLRGAGGTGCRFGVFLRRCGVLAGCWRGTRCRLGGAGCRFGAAWEWDSGYRIIGLSGYGVMGLSGCWGWGLRFFGVAYETLVFVGPGQSLPW